MNTEIYIKNNFLKYINNIIANFTPYTEYIVLSINFKIDNNVKIIIKSKQNALFISLNLSNNFIYSNKDNFSIDILYQDFEVFFYNLQKYDIGIINIHQNLERCTITLKKDNTIISSMELLCNIKGSSYKEKIQENQFYLQYTDNLYIPNSKSVNIKFLKNITIPNIFLLNIFKIANSISEYRKSILEFFLNNLNSNTYQQKVYLHFSNSGDINLIYVSYRFIYKINFFYLKNSEFLEYLKSNRFIECTISTPSALNLLIKLHNNEPEVYISYNYLILSTETYSIYMPIKFNTKYSNYIIDTSNYKKNTLFLTVLFEYMHQFILSNKKDNIFLNKCKISLNVHHANITLLDSNQRIINTSINHNFLSKNVNTIIFFIYLDILKSIYAFLKLCKININNYCLLYMSEINTRLSYISIPNIMLYTFFVS